MFILDTMVVSEDIKLRPNPSVRAWLHATERDKQFISVVSIGEIRFGIDRLPASGQKRRLETWFAALVPFFDGRFLPVDLAVAYRWGRLRHDAGRSISASDSLIGATALVHDFTVVTRNVGHFSDFGVRILNPWLP